MKTLNLGKIFNNIINSGNADILDFVPLPTDDAKTVKLNQYIAYNMNTSETLFDKFAEFVNDEESYNISVCECSIDYGINNLNGVCIGTLPIALFLPYKNIHQFILVWELSATVIETIAMSDSGEVEVKATITCGLFNTETDVNLTIDNSVLSKNPTDKNKAIIQAFVDGMNKSLNQHGYLGLKPLGILTRQDSHDNIDDFNTYTRNILNTLQTKK